MIGGDLDMIKTVKMSLQSLGQRRIPIGGNLEIILCGVAVVLKSVAQMRRRRGQTFPGNKPVCCRQAGKALQVGFPDQADDESGKA